MRREQDREGYLIIDHSASPGLPPEIARKCGFDPDSVGEGATLEAATMTCAHCKSSVVMNPRRIRKREKCFRCDHYVCDMCYQLMQHPDYIHFSFEKRVDRIMSGEEKPKGLLLYDSWGNVVPITIAAAGPVAGR